jgi:hypothetical protein
MNEAQMVVALIGLLREMGGWGIDIVLTTALIVPPLLGFVLVIVGVRTIRSLERVMIEGQARNEAIANSNATLVADHQKLVRGYQAQTDSMMEIIKENTRAITLATARMEGAQGIRS